MIRITTPLIFGILFPLFLPAQTLEEYEANYASRIRQEMINGVYIPADLDEAFEELERLSETAGIAKFKAAPEAAAARRLHFGLGRWILINWGLEEGSRISHYLRLKGIHHPDDMIRVIIVSWHRHLTGKPIALDEQVAVIAKRVEEEIRKRAARADTIAILKREDK